MRAVRHILFVSALVACGVVSAVPDPGRAGESDAARASLLAWEGRHPFDEGGNFFDDPAIAAITKKNIPATMVRDISTLQVTTPFEKNGDILHSRLCKPHDCPSAFVDVYLDVTNRTIQLCMSEYDPKMRQNKEFWVGRTIRKLEEGSCTGDMKAFAAFRDPE